mgnify:CR=1 FL=1
MTNAEKSRRAYAQRCRAFIKLKKYGTGKEEVLRAFAELSSYEQKLVTAMMRKIVAGAEIEAMRNNGTL